MRVLRARGLELGAGRLRAGHRPLVAQHVGDRPGQPPLHDGECLQAEDGRVVRVTARPEQLLHVTCSSAYELTRAAYHLGNRHVALQVGDGWLRLLDDYVLKAMLEQLGAHTETIEAPFQPEHGAYGGGHHHSRHGDEDFNYPPKLHQFGVRL